MKLRETAHRFINANQKIGEYLERKAVNQFETNMFNLFAATYSIFEKKSTIYYIFLT